MKRNIITLIFILIIISVKSQTFIFSDYWVSDPDTLQLELIKDSTYYQLTKTYDYNSAIEFYKKSIDL